MGEWTPTAEWYAALLSREDTDDDRSRPYPFFLASPLEARPTALGDPARLAGRVEVGRHPRAAGAARAAVQLWSRGEELITHRFPEIVAAAPRLPEGTVLDGEVLAFRDARPLPFSALQQRIGRQKQVEHLVRAVPCRVHGLRRARARRRRRLVADARAERRAGGRTPSVAAPPAFTLRASRERAPPPIGFPSRRSPTIAAVTRVGALAGFATNRGRAASKGSC